MTSETSRLDGLAIQLASLFGAGRAPIAPGTVGTLATLPLALLAWRQLPAWGLALIGLAVAGAGVWAGDVAARATGLKDPGLVVIDEAAGMIITLVGVPFGWVNALAAFVLFRAMDVIKPPPARQFERLPGGWGIMLDDVMAGLYANLALRLLLKLAGALRG